MVAAAEIRLSCGSGLHPTLSTLDNECIDYQLPTWWPSVYIETSFASHSVQVNHSTRKSNDGCYMIVQAFGCVLYSSFRMEISEVPRITLVGTGVYVCEKS